jgi:hypothetical protein
MLTLEKRTSSIVEKTPDVTVGEPRLSCPAEPTCSAPPFDVSSLDQVGWLRFRSHFVIEIADFKTVKTRQVLLFALLEDVKTAFRHSS